MRTRDGSTLRKSVLEQVVAGGSEQLAIPESTLKPVSQTASMRPRSGRSRSRSRGLCRRHRHFLCHLRLRLCLRLLLVYRKIMPL